MTESVRFENGSEIEVEADGEEFKGYIDPADISFEYDDEVDAVHYGTSTIGSVSTDYQSELRELKIDELQEISGVGRRKAEALYREGYKNVNDVRRASQSELSEIDEIGNALAARIKADVGDYEVGEEFDIDTEEIIRELQEEKEDVSFLDESTLMVNVHE